MRAVPRLCEFHPGICLTIEDKAWKTLSQGSQECQYTNYQNTHYETHTHTHTLQNPHTPTHPHITKQFKTTTVVKINKVQDIPK